MKHFPHWVHLWATLCRGGAILGLDSKELSADERGAWEVAEGRSSSPSTISTSGVLSVHFPPDVWSALLVSKTFVSSLHSHLESLASWGDISPDSIWFSDVCVSHSAPWLLISLSKGRWDNDEKSCCSEEEDTVGESKRTAYLQLGCLSGLHLKINC